MLFLTLFLASTITILIPGCSSSKSAENQQGSKPKADNLKKKDAGKTPIHKEQTSKKEEIVVTSKPTLTDSAKTATPGPPKNPEAVKPTSPILGKTKDAEKAPKKKAPPKNLAIKESKYAGIQEKPEEKPPTQKLPSVMTIPSKEPTTAHPAPEELPKARSKVEINEKSDDTIENIPSVKTKEGVSFEGDSNAVNSPVGTKEDGKLVSFIPGEMAKEKKK